MAQFSKDSTVGCLTLLCAIANPAARARGAYARGGVVLSGYERGRSSAVHGRRIVVNEDEILAYLERNGVPVCVERAGSVWRVARGSRTA